MAKGVRRPVKRKIVHAPPPAAEGAAEFDPDFKHLRSDMKRNREAFVREYIKDFNGSAAMRRLGSKSKQPWIRASEWLDDAYTQWYLSKMLAELDEKAIVTRNEVLFGLKKEANYHGIDGSAAARISAWRTMAKILGIEVTKVEGNINLGGGVMLLPLSGTPSDWEKAAAAAQEKLKQEVRK